MLGSYVFDLIKDKQSNYDIIPITRKIIDCSSPHIKAELCRFFEENSIKSEDIVINCVGLIPQRPCIDKIDMIKVNSLFPNLLSIECRYINCKLIHISTNCVFSGERGLYTELDRSDAFDDYGRTKFLGEPSFGTIIRTSIIGEESKNKFSLLEWAKANQWNKIKGFTNHFWNGVTTLQLAFFINTLIDENRKDQLIHYFTPNEVVSKYALLKMISNVYDLNLNIIPHSTDITKTMTLDTIYKNNLKDVPPLHKQLEQLRDYRKI